MMMVGTALFLWKSGSPRDYTYRSPRAAFPHGSGDLNSEPQSCSTLYLLHSGGSYLIDQDPRHVLMGRLQGLSELGVGMHELRATLPGGTLHDAVC